MASRRARSRRIQAQALAWIDRVRRRHVVPHRQVERTDAVVGRDAVQRLARAARRGRAVFRCRHLHRPACCASRMRASRGCCRSAASTRRDCQHAIHARRQSCWPCILRRCHPDCGPPHQITDRGDEQRHRDPADRLDLAPQRRFRALAAEADRDRDRNTRLPRPTAMLARNGSSGTPTMPDAQVKNFNGIGANPASTSIQNAFHGDCAAIPRRYATCAVDLSIQPSDTNSGFDQFEGVMAQRVADHRADQRAEQAQRREPEAAPRLRQAIGASITSGGDREEHRLERNSARRATPVRADARPRPARVRRAARRSSCESPMPVAHQSIIARQQRHEHDRRRGCSASTTPSASLRKRISVCAAAADRPAPPACRRARAARSARRPAPAPAAVTMIASNGASSGQPMRPSSCLLRTLRPSWRKRLRASAQQFADALDRVHLQPERGEHRAPGSRSRCRFRAPSAACRAPILEQGLGHASPPPTVARWSGRGRSAAR